SYVIYRLAMYVLLSLALIFGIVAGTGTGLFLDSMFATPGMFVRIGGFAGFTIVAVVLYGFRANWLFSIKAPHVALLNESGIQPGWARVVEARKLVRKRFSTSAELHTLDKRIQAVLAFLFKQNTGLGQRIAKLDTTMFSRLVSVIAEIPATYVHEIILSECLKDATRSASGAAVGALSLYAQNFQRLFNNQSILFSLKGVAWLVIFVLMLTPVGWVDEIIPAEFGIWSYVFALLLSWPIKSSLFDPIGVAAMLGVFSDLTRAQTIDPQWERKLTEQSAQFASLKKRAEFLDDGN
ncbi:MAG: hypothetical protein ACRERS_06770, partial [Methylococcales bacterium]